ncbi:hypothetical protein [Caulobacter sp. 17J65-9]|uniref:hypothetical protein n=1 Tax=Caulobacter sp. 17J65-9 TaxID=2709382 RepID=UPI0013CA0CE3|nr:hypothetical protein [Caulobacter sp. 17J65-9]NEX95221.1 hypothetical protein [Caulobacter sp. 17J65-9]
MQDGGGLWIFGLTVWLAALAMPLIGAFLLGWAARACFERGRQWGGGVLTLGCLLLLACATGVGLLPVMGLHA